MDIEIAKFQGTITCKVNPPPKKKRKEKVKHHILQLPILNELSGFPPESIMIWQKRNSNKKKGKKTEQNCESIPEIMGAGMSIDSNGGATTTLDIPRAARLDNALSRPTPVLLLLRSDRDGVILGNRKQRGPPIGGGIPGGRPFPAAGL